MPIKPGKLNDIQYVKTEDDVSDRCIIPFSVPPTSLKSLDVSELTDKQKATMEEAVSKYNDYLTIQHRTTMSFEDFITLMRIPIKSDSIKYRNFTVSKIRTQ